MPLKIGGVEDHVHVLFGLKTVHCIADFVRELKKASSVWASENHEREFEWQGLCHLHREREYDRNCERLY
jgi:REP element-mobilizing transposase RayT